MEKYQPDPASIAGQSLDVAERTRLLVIGAGPAGLAAASEATRLGLQVVLLDENPVPADMMGEDVPLMFGQRMGGAVRNRNAMTEAFLASDPAIEAAFDAGVDIRLGTAAWGVYANNAGVHWLPGLVAGVTDGEKSWMIGCERIIVAAGRRDMGLAFPGWELPGVLGVTAAQRLADRYGSLDIRRAVLLGTTVEALSAALSLVDRGVEIVAAVEQAEAAIGPASLVEALMSRGVPFLFGHAPRQGRSGQGRSGQGGFDGIESLEIARVDRDGRLVEGTERLLSCDAVLLGIGTTPVIELLAAAGGEMEFHAERGGFAPVLDAARRSTIGGVYAVGDCAGVWAEKTLSADIARAEGRCAARDAAESLGVATDRTEEIPFPATAGSLTADHDLAGYRLAWARACIVNASGAPHVCRCEEVTARELLEVRPPRYLGWTAERRNDRDLHSMLGEGVPHPDQVKRLTRAGMGLCQGRRCREQVAALLALSSGEQLAAIPLATYRAPVRPLPLGVAGQAREPAAHWDTWFGMASQYQPFWDIHEPYTAAGRDVSGKVASE
ncbi:MAG TPA: NAD(P)/FAD-dependent oxidoreductase [Acidiphilium sp.]